MLWGLVSCPFALPHLLLYVCECVCVHACICRASPLPLGRSDLGLEGPMQLPEDWGCWSESSPSLTQDSASQPQPLSRLVVYRMGRRFLPLSPC